MKTARSMAASEQGQGGGGGGVAAMDTEGLAAALGPGPTPFAGGAEARALESNEVKAIVEEVCALEQFEGMRAARMDQDDILALLAAFNERGIHFC